MSALDAFLAAIDAAPNDRMPQLIAADYLDEIGRSVDATRMRTCPPMVRPDVSYGGGDGGGGGYGDGGGSDGHGGYGDGHGGYGDGYGGDGYGGGGYGDGYDGYGGYGGGDGGGVCSGVEDIPMILSRGVFMSDGLRLIHTPSGWNPYVIVAWCRVRDGWINYAPGYRVIRRFGNNAQLSQLAATGPLESTQLLDPAPLPGGCSTAIVSRFDICNPSAWAKEMPKPEGWK